jgi:hypothetical protein
MERRRSFGATPGKLGSRRGRDLEDSQRLRFAAGSSSAINFLGNPRFKPRAAFKTMQTSEEMEDRRRLFTNHALVVKGALGLRSPEELKGLILHHFGIRKHEFYIYHCHPTPFILLFLDVHDRDVVFAAGKIIEGPIELSFLAWEVDAFGTEL